MSELKVSEAGSVQFPMVRHAAEIGWTPLTQDEALDKRGGEKGLFLYDELRAALLKLNPGLVTNENVQEVTDRLERMERALDSVAIEVERISEGQRFTTKLLSEGRGLDARQIPSSASSRDLGT